MGLINELKRSNKKTKLMKKLEVALCNSTYEKKEEFDSVFDEFYEFISNDKILGPIIQIYSVDPKLIKKTMEQLYCLGLRYVKGQFVPVSAFSFARPLTYMLKSLKNNTDIYEICYEIKKIM